MGPWPYHKEQWVHRRVAAWLADPGAHGLVRGSFDPPEPIRQLRDLTRTRTTITRERAREIQRLEKSPWGRRHQAVLRRERHQRVAGRAMLEGVSRSAPPATLADLAKRRMRSKIPELTEVLTGRFGERHGFLARLHLDLSD